MEEKAATLTRKIVESGTLHCDGSCITYTFLSQSVSFPISEVAVIGELTMDNGPFDDDWFLVFVLRGSGEWYEFPMYAAGAKEVLRQLVSALGDPLQIGLANHTDFASRVMWPPPLIERPLFTFSRLKESGFCSRLRSWIIPEMHHCLSPDVLSVVNTAT